MPNDDELNIIINDFKNNYKDITTEEYLDLINSIYANYNKIINLPEHKEDEDINMEIGGLFYFIKILQKKNVKINQVISIFYYLYNMRFDDVRYSYNVNFFWHMISTYLSRSANLQFFIEKIIEYIPKFEKIFANSNNDVLYRILMEPNINADLEDDFTLNMRSSRLTNYYKNCSNVQNQLEMISINGRIISNTSGDFHNKSCSPLFIKINNKEYVYKNRLFQTEKVIDEIFYIYGVCKGKNDLSPIPEIYGTSLFAYMEKVIYEKNMTQEEALNYVYKIGEMCYIVLLTGISDLHKENIIATKKGPMIIDGECVFDIYELSKKIDINNLQDTCINEIITNIAKRNHDNITNTMEITVSNNNIQLYIKNKDNIKNLTIYGQYLANGFNEARKNIKTHHLINCIYKNVGEKLKLRYIPIGTLALNGVFGDYKSGCIYITGKIIEKINDLIFNIFNIHNYLSLKKQLIISKLEEIYKRGDVPIFYFVYTDSELLILLEDYILVLLRKEKKSIDDIIINLIYKREMDLDKLNIEDLIKQ